MRVDVQHSEFGARVTARMEGDGEQTPFNLMILLTAITY